MTINSLKCPECDGILNMEIEGRKFVFCPYCGNQMELDDGNREYTINKNININRNINNITRNIDDVELTKAKAATIQFIVSFGVLAFIAIITICFSLVKSAGEKKEHARHERAIEWAKEEGKLSVGDSADYVGISYKTAVKKLNALGFNNIETVDLGDDGLWKNKKDSIDTISIDGNIQFDEDDFFYPEDKIVIMYH